MAARALASGTGPRTTGSATVVASVSRPERSMTLASAVGPSSQGVWKTRWSLAETEAKPQSLAVSTVLLRRSSESGSSPNCIRGRCTPRSTPRSSQPGGGAASGPAAAPCR